MTEPWPYAGFERQLKYIFRDRSLLIEALTHASVKGADPTRPENGRLAFLGDAVLDLVVGEHHFDAKARLSKHELTKQRAEFVANKVIGSIPSQRLEIPLITGDSIPVGSSTPNMRATALEAVIGAVYLDGGMTKAQQVVLDLLGLRTAGRR